LERENKRVLLDNEQLRRDLTDSRKRIADQSKQIADLERKLGLREQNSTTSSKPPSSDGLAGKQRPRCSSQRKKKKSGRKPGGQPGHPGHHRELVPPERVDEVVPLYPWQCSHCEKPFGERDRTRDASGEPQRHQVTELPKIEAHITEYRCHKLQCARCGQKTQATLPEELKGGFGPELTALIAYLTVTCRMPRRVVLESLEHVPGIPLSLGSVQNVWQEAGDAVAGPYEELARQLPREPVLNSDETVDHWRRLNADLILDKPGHASLPLVGTNGEKRWLWAFVAATFVFYKVAATRGAEVLVELLGAVLTRSAEQGRPGL
jgi:transposase